MTRSRLLRLGLLASAAAIALLVLAPGVVGRIDLPVYDLLVRPDTSPPSTRVAVVAIDDRSLADLGRWPWGRERLATLIERLREMGAPTIAIDMLLAEPDPASSATVSQRITASDEALGAALGPDVVLGYALTFSEPPNGDTPRHPLRAAIVERAGTPAASERLFHAQGCVCILPSLAAMATRSGFLNVGVDADGTLRRAPLLMSLRDAVYPSLALAATLPFRHDVDARLEVPGAVPLRLGLGDRTIPLGDDGTMAVRFRSGQRQFAHISAADILNGVADRSQIDGRLVFVGVTALGLRDAVSTAVDRQLAGVDVQATIAANILDRRFIGPFPRPRLSQSLMTLAAALLTAMAISRAGYRRGTLVGTTAMAAIWAGAAVMLNVWGLYLSPLLPTVATAGVIGGAGWLRATAERTRAEEERRRREQAHDFIAKSLTSLIEIRDRSTGQHARRTQGYSRLLLRPLAKRPEFRDYLTPERVDTLSLLAPLHDIGKVGIRDAVLNKPGSLTPEEMEEMRLHPVYGFETIAKAEQQVGVDSADDLAILQLAKDIVYTHHERWDGNGYPRGLRGPEIPLAGRIMAVVDVYDALVEPRPYRRQMPHSEAVALILAGRGTQFDPQVVEAFMSVAPSFAALRSVMPAQARTTSQ